MQYMLKKMFKENVIILTLKPYSGQMWAK